MPGSGHAVRHHRWWLPCRENQEMLKTSARPERGGGGGGRGHYKAERVRTVQGFASFTAKESDKITELKRKHGYQKFLLAFHLNLNM